MGIRAGSLIRLEFPGKVATPQRRPRPIEYSGTDSPLIALYFSVRDSTADDEDGVVWGLMPTDLNQAQIGSKTIMGAGHPPVQNVFANVWKTPVQQIEAPEIIAINTQHVDVRQMVQASQFTIHGSELSITEVENAEMFLIRNAPAQRSWSIPNPSDDHPRARFPNPGVRFQTGRLQNRNSGAGFPF